MGAFLLMIFGLTAIVMATRFRLSWLIMVILIFPSFYMVSRGTGMWDAENLLEVIRQNTSEERAGSMEFRIKNENMLSEKAREHLIFGWGGWKRSYVRNDAGETISIPDGLWILAYGQNGLFGLTALTLTLLLPQILFLRKFPIKTWREPAVAALVPLSVLLGLFMLDNLLNNMFNPVMLLSAGGLTGLYIRDPAGLITDPGLTVPDIAYAEKPKTPRLL